MTHARSKLFIAAPTSVVFGAVADIDQLPRVVKAVRRIERLSGPGMGIGTRFREVRLHRGREMITELEVVELGDDHIRLVADSHGTIWDTRFVVREHPEGAELEVEMHARAKNPLARLMNVLFARVYRREMEQHFAEVRAWCEARR